MMNEKIDLLCRQCNSKCCRYFCFEIDEPDCFDEFDNLRWFLLHEGISVHIDEGSWFISIANKCKQLADDGRCLEYETRPAICRDYTTESCDETGGDYDYEELFETADQIAAYARKTLGRKKYDKAWAKMCAKPSDECSAEKDKPSKSKKKEKKKEKKKKDKKKDKKKGKPKDKGKSKDH